MSAIDRENHVCPKCGRKGFTDWIFNQYENQLYSACRGCGYCESRRPNDYIPSGPRKWWERFLAS